MPTKVPPIKEFPKDDRIWRIDWLGRVDRTSAEVLIVVHLSPARNKTLFLRGQGDFDVHAAVKIWVGVGLLPFLAIGSLWRDGRRQRKDFGYLRNFRSIEIQETVRTATAGLIMQKEPEVRWLIPKFRHELDRSCWFSPLFAIEHEGDPYGILVPMIEAIRFYYAVSSDMAHIAFSGALQLDLDSVVNTRSTVDSRLHDSGRMVLHLRQWLADDDAWVIGRVLSNVHAEDGIARIYDSLLRNMANYKTAFAECGLPFAGTTNWATRGIEVPKENGNGHRWLIYELIDCSAPFPFDNLEVVRDNDGRIADPLSDIPDDEKRPAWSPVQRATKTSLGTEVQSDDPPRADLQAVVVPSAGERFSALRGKEIIKTPKDQCRYKKTAVSRTERVDVLGTGDPTGSETAAGGAPASIEWQREIKRSEALPASFESLHAVVDALNCFGGTKAHVRELSGSAEFLRLTKPSGYRQWSYLDSAHRIRRRVMVIDIDCDGVLGCLVEYERRDSERSRIALFVLRELGQMPESFLIRLLHGLVAVEGVWANLKSYPTGVRLTLFNHSRPSAAKFATDLCGAMRKTLK